MASKRYKKLPEKTKELSAESIEKLLPELKKNCTTKFDESLDLSFQINNKQKKSEVNIRTVVNLPGGTGKKEKVALVCEEAKAEEAKLKEKEDFKTLYEQTAGKMEAYKAQADKWTSYETAKREKLLNSVPEEERDAMSKLDLETLEFVTNKINNTKPNAPEVVGTSKGFTTNKSWGDMTDSERRAFYEERARG